MESRDLRIIRQQAHVHPDIEAGRNVAHEVPTQRRLVQIIGAELLCQWRYTLQRRDSHDLRVYRRSHRQQRHGD